MDIEFSSKRLQDASLSFSEATRLFGIAIGRKYIQRVSVIMAAEKFEVLFGINTLSLHPLKGDRSEQYAISLNGNYRLIVEKISEDVIRIVDVEDYHGN